MKLKPAPELHEKIKYFKRLAKPYRLYKAEIPLGVRKAAERLGHKFNF